MNDNYSTTILEPRPKILPQKICFGKLSYNGDDHKVLVMANTETGTVTILEYPSSDIACFLVVGDEFEMTKEKSKSKPTKGQPISLKKVLD